MLPIYSDLLKMWSDLGYDLPIKEGKYWLENNFIQAFTRDGTLRKLWKYKAFDDLHIEITPYHNKIKFCEGDFETWEETVDRLSEHIETLKLESITLISKYLEDDRQVVVANSTGKDSMVVSHLISEITDNYDTYFNVTTLDVAESNLMAKHNGYKFTYPDIEKYGGFYQQVKSANLIPTRLNRYCCRIYKEEATVNSFPSESKLLILFGMRNEESVKRSNYTDVWCNEKWGKRDWIGILPIRKWTELDVWLYTLKYGVEVNPKYKMGYSRVGCGIACPNYSKSTWVLDKYWYNNLYNRWRDILKDDFIKNNKWLIMNCTIKEYIDICWNGGVYRSEPTQEVIEEFAKYNDLDYEVAKRYFNNCCANGCLNSKKKPLKVKDKTTLAMNLKMNGRNTNKIYCKKCLMKELEMSKEEWDNNVADFKAQGCKLF